MSSKSLLTIVALLLIQNFLISQKTNVPTESLETIVRLAPGEKLSSKHHFSARLLVPALNIHLLRYATPAARAADLTRLSRRPEVLAVEPNRPVDFRTEPNDEHYAEEQMNMVRAGFERAWDLTTGGITSDGEEIVVAVLDAGFDYDHPDLRDNVWLNADEIPGDGLDNDGNGYVDDLSGWDMTGGNATAAGTNHGTSVAGIVGARGNNAIGVAGTNWDIRMMLLVITNAADIIEAYGYVLEQRRRYNESGGQRGALVVATNASFGMARSTCAQFPVWAGMYEELGQAGVLTAASAVNDPVDIDLIGDMPSDCPTDFVISVTNVDENDRLYVNAGFGREHVDLAAPGEGSYTTLSSGRYGGFSRSSAAAPYVTGAIALLYATPCPALREIVRRAPADAARLVRAVLLSSTTEHPSLAFRTSSGGALAVAEAQRLLIDECAGNDHTSLTITGVSPNPAATVVELQTSAIVLGDGARVELYDMTGRLLRTQRPVRVAAAPVRLRIDVGGLPVGAYSIRLTERDRTATARLIVH